MARKPTKKKRTKKGKAPKDVRGYIIRPVDPERYGYLEKGHMEGKDALSAVPPDILEAMRRGMKAGSVEMEIVEVSDGEQEIELRIEDVDPDMDDDA